MTASFAIFWAIQSNPICPSALLLQGAVGAVCGFIVAPLCPVAIVSSAVETESEDAYNHLLDHFRPEAVDGPKIGLLVARQPHEIDVLSQCLGYLVG